MADYTNDYVLQSKIIGTRATIKGLADYHISDAIALVDREAGVHQLSGHYASIVPLAVFFSHKYPSYLANIKNRTSLRNGMGETSGLGYQEARNSEIWSPIKDAMADFKAIYGTDIITKNSNGDPKTVNDILNYLSEKYSGNLKTGGGGDTVFKRTLKILGHIFY
ncbi:hypothetical protein [Ornithinibacillus bavariensis]|uniref:hypothetical protein n=1 Tax=Ornithinibacillus bavariensis TaxID=545502 RepID=UPI000EDAAB65|nr:hypothetical protein [Ornithinibacillus sp.]